MAKKIGKGQLLTELVKGSMEYTMSLIKSAFSSQFPNRDMGPYFWVEEIFSDYVIVKSYSDSSLKSDEYYKVPYSKSDETYNFIPKDQWEVVELAYQPQTTPPPAPPQMADERRNLERGEKKKRGRRLEETVSNAITLLESAEEEKPDGPWRIKATGITADVINGNGRRYPASVLKAAVQELKNHLHESAGQGRILSLTGESDHPKDKGNSVPLLGETVFNWDKVDFDGTNVLLEGNLLGTSKGKDIHAQMRGGVIPGMSQRGYGESKKVKVNGESIDEITQLIITGYDATAPNQQSDPNGSINYFESQSSMENEMNEMLEQLKKLLAEHPELFNKGMTEAQLEALNEKQLKKLDESLRNALGIGADVNIVETVKVNAEKARKFDESQAKSQVDEAVKTATKDLPFGEKLNKIFVEAFQGVPFTDAKAVEAFAESQRRQFSQLAAAGVLTGLGFDENTKSVKVLGGVLERETGIPEFGRAAFEIIESVRKHENRAKRALELRAESPAAVFTENLLKRFDALYQHKLIAEARMFEEAEAVSDLNLPYSVSRAIIAEAYPNLVAANVFDIGVMEQTPMNIYYEAFAGETGYSMDITDEVETGGAENTWYDLAHANIVPGTMVVTSNPAGTTYVEGTDFIIDYMLGKILFLTAGSIGANDILATYTYHATRQGEGVAIERAKTTLSYQTITAAAMRLADDINHEAIVFSRSQLGWDAVGRTMANLIKELRHDIDRSLIEKAVMAALSVASNSTAAWDVSDAVYATLVALIGQAKVKVLKRFYEPTSVLMSVTNADYLSNWDGFKRDGFPNALLNAAGFAGSVKGLPVFNSTEMRDTWNLVLNRELVMHRVYQPMTVKGPFPKYSSDKLIAAEQYYAEEYNASLAPIGGKGSLVPTQA